MAWYISITTISYVTIHTHASFYQLIGYWGVNYNRFCTQNAKVKKRKLLAFWRMIPTTLAWVWKVTFLQTAQSKFQIFLLFFLLPEFIISCEPVLHKQGLTGSIIYFRRIRMILCIATASCKVFAGSTTIPYVVLECMKRIK